MRARCASLPACASARPTISVSRNGSTTSPRPSASNATATSKPAPPKPPSASSNSAPITPSPAKRCHMSALKPAVERAIVSRVLNPYCSATKRLSVSASMRRSSVCWKSMASLSKTENHLGDDVLLDFVGAAEDRQLAVVEVLRGGAGGFVGADRVACITFFKRFLDEWRGIWSHRAAQQRGNLLADLGAANLEHRAFRAGHAAARHGGDHAQVRRLHVLQIDLDLRDA